MIFLFLFVDVGVIVDFIVAKVPKGTNNNHATTSSTTNNSNDNNTPTKKGLSAPQNKL